MTEADPNARLEAFCDGVFAIALTLPIIDLMTWIDQPAALELVSESSASFVYANGFQPLTVVFIPFPTSLLGEFILTDHAAPALHRLLSITAFWFSLTVATITLASWAFWCCSAIA